MPNRGMSGKERSLAGIAVISDIHANRAALEVVLADIDRRGVEATYCLGDLVGYGPEPNEVIDLIRAHAIPCVSGNYDDGIGWERGSCGCYYADAEARRLGDASYAFTEAQVTADRRVFLRDLPRERRLALGGESIHLVHGSPQRINEYLFRRRSERTFLRLAQAETGNVLVFGHTHDPWWRMIGGVLFVNVGSVGRPKDGDPRSAYTVLRPRPAGALEVEMIRVSYDVEAAARATLAAGLPAELAEALRRGK